MSSSTSLPPMPIPSVPKKSLTAYKSLSFDIYGTLIDWESTILQQLKPLIEAAPQSSPYKNANTDATSRTRLASRFHHYETQIQSESPSMVYDELLRQTYLRLATDMTIPITDTVDSQARAFGGSVGSWLAFPDTVDAMIRLGKYYKLVPLSNVDRASFARTCDGPLKGVPFWKAYLAQDIGSYKPDLRNFEYLLRKLDEDDRAEGGEGIGKGDDLMVAQSLFHDHMPCKKMGIASVWIARMGAGMGLAGGVEEVHQKGDIGYGWRFGTLGEFADEVERVWKDEGKEARY